MFMTSFLQVESHIFIYFCFRFEITCFSLFPFQALQTETLKVYI